MSSREKYNELNKNAKPAMVEPGYFKRVLCERYNNCTDTGPRAASPLPLPPRSSSFSPCSHARGRPGAFASAFPAQHGRPSRTQVRVSAPHVRARAMPLCRAATPPCPVPPRPMPLRANPPVVPSAGPFKTYVPQVIPEGLLYQQAQVRCLPRPVPSA